MHLIRVRFLALAMAVHTLLAAGSVVAQPLDPVLRVSPKFAVERVYAVPRDSQGSWVSLASDRRGVLYASDQYGPIYRVELGAAAGDEVSVRPVKLPIGGVHGMAWVGKRLFAIVGQRDVCETGLYQLTDTDADEELDTAELLQPLAGDGEHGPHAVVAAADGQSLFVMGGNAAPLPKLDRSRVPHNGRSDSLLPPLGALIGSETRGLPHGGWICRTDLNGQNWELLCSGLRNAYSLASNSEGDVFTFDSDTEFEIGLPWYRPTRVFHCLSGADHGWRPGALKVPADAPDTIAPLASLGLGSPTAVLFATGAKFPERYRTALFVADWSFGRLIAVHLRPSGAGFTAESEEILTGTPLPITAACVNPRDGAMYFVVGGRKTQSALYRLSWKGPEAVDDRTTVEVDEKARSQRRLLESFHGRVDAAAVETLWPYLGSQDGALRHAARIALESQPVQSWQERALAERRPREALAALLALARTGDSSAGPRLLGSLEVLDWNQLGSLRPEWLRVVTLAFTRLGAPSATERERWIALLSPRLPSDERAQDAALCELLIYLKAPDAAAKAMARLAAAPTSEEQIDYARMLRTLEVGWTPDLRGQYFDWLGKAAALRGGASLPVFLNRIRADALAATPERDRPGMQARLAAATPPAGAPTSGFLAGRALVKQYSLDELVALANEEGKSADAAKGRHLFAAACAACHTFAGEGGALGTDLTTIVRRLNTRDLLEAIIDPSKEISDQYGTVVLTRRDGSQVQGRVVNIAAGTIHVAQNLLNPSAVVKIPVDQIESIRASKVSLMPAGLLNVLTTHEIADLLAFLRVGQRQP
jgi:putative heme-binding domain-containing protein